MKLTPQAYEVYEWRSMFIDKFGFPPTQYLGRSKFGDIRYRKCLKELKNHGLYNATKIKFTYRNAS